MSNGTMFGDLDWPINASRGLSASAEFLLRQCWKFFLLCEQEIVLKHIHSWYSSFWQYDSANCLPVSHTRTVTVRSHRRRLSVFIGVCRETVSCPDEHRIWADFFISTGSVDLDAILHDKRRWTRMNADFIPDALRSTAIYNDRNHFRPDILGF